MSCTPGRRRSRPTRSPCRPRSATPARPARGATNVNFYLGTTKVGTANVGALAAGATDAPSRPTSAPRNAGTLPAERQGRRGQHGRSSRTTPTTRYTNPTHAGGRAGRQLRPGRLGGELVAEQPVGRQHRHVLGGDPATRARVASAGGAHGITLTVLNDAGTAVRTLTGSYTGAIAAGATTRAGQPGHLDGRQRQVHGPRRARRRRQRAAGQAGQQHQRAAVLRRSRREHAVRHVRGRGRRRSAAARSVVGPNRTIGDLAGEASGRRAVTLNSHRRLRRVDHQGAAPTRWSPGSPSRTRAGRRRHQLDAEHLRQRHASTRRSP